MNGVWRLEKYCQLILECKESYPVCLWELKLISDHQYHQASVVSAMGDRQITRIILTICNSDGPPKGEGNQCLHKGRCQGESYEPGEQGGLTDMRVEREEDSVL